MLSGKKVVVILPAYNAEKTLEQTISAIPKGSVDDFILVDDYSTDGTFELGGNRLKLTKQHHQNIGL